MRYILLSLLSLFAADPVELGPGKVDGDVLGLTAVKMDGAINDRAKERQQGGRITTLRLDDRTMDLQNLLQKSTGI